MVMREAFKRFARDEKGVSMIEGLLVVPLVLLVFAAVIEFGFAVWQWNQTVKAMQLGARLAAVSDPLIGDTQWDALIAAVETGAEPGDSTPDPRSNPTEPTTQSCGAGAGNSCVEARIDRLIYGDDNRCDPDWSAGGVTPGICDFNDNIGPDNLLITYRNSGLGYVGRPNGPVVTVTVETRNLTFRLPLLGALLGLDDFEIPPHPVTVLSEDLSTTRL